MSEHLADSARAILSDDAMRILNTLQEGIVISNHDGVILFSNDRYFDVSSIAPGEILGKPALELVHDGMFDLVLNPEIVREGRPATRIQQVFNGRRLVLDGNPVLDDSGRVSLVITFIRDSSSLEEAGGRVLAQRELLEAFSQVRGKAESQTPPYIFQSAEMLGIRGKLNSLAPTDAAVLLLGETGVGKDVLARKIHMLSARARKNFIKVDCGSIPESLIESELFGYEPGAFTGGLRQGKMGLLEAASQGTLFLDEVGELPVSLQTRLLRVLQDREIMRIGAVKPRPVNLRIIAATSRNLEYEIKQARFRQDLFYRLKVAVVEIPPLRRRMADILPLAATFLHFYSQKYHKERAFSQEAEKTLLAHSWPGNIRELENLVQSAVVQSRKHLLSPADLGLSRPPAREDPSPLPSAMGESYKQAMESFEYSLLSSAVREHGSLARAASSLEMDRSTLFRKLKAFEAAGYPSPTRLRLRRRQPPPHQT